ncbi:LTA synthase family protein [Clostridium sp. AM58-1XD]|uniref:LTA synthase family protein n=1 Tax=Clostridium sp. AM58-1XD TaxID=2292307 RepID=UPI000E4F2A17|nr:LTA synthase family protein [Clostridium sp. AM58-1XD]RGY99463.1 LTA synthase family protein [Clostridium sp. AM58-1XD]
MKRCWWNWYLKIILASFAVNSVIEVLGRKSFAGTWKYIVGNPQVFLLNTAIIMILFLPVFLTRRKWFLFILAAVIWLFAGVVNGVLLAFRTTPFTAADFRLVKYAMGMLTTYMSWPEIILALAGLAGAGVLLAFLWKKAPAEEKGTPYLTAVLICAVTAAGGMGYTKYCIESGIVAVHFGNIGQAFKEYGFPYGFANSLVNTGISKPREYDEETMKQIEKEMIPAHTYTLSEEELPNIVMIQLESFFDPSLWSESPVKENVVPFFQYLRRNYPSGYLKVPSVGAGTANTEFECITGMNLDFFGPGEYPYKTVLRKTACESIPFDLSRLGYATHAIHNNEATFYDRNKVFSQLGFDTFTPIEYMYNIEKNPIGWCRDKILTGEITDTLDSTKGPDFIYTISVQGHGAYPDFEYYCSQIKEMDDFIRELIRTMNARSEPSVVIMYGDHLPGFSWDASEMAGGSLYQTQYVMWNNLGLENIKKNVEAYQLGAHVLDMLGIHEGTMIRFHQAWMERDLAIGIQGSLLRTERLRIARQKIRKKYQEDMKALQYDMLYGDHEIYGGELPFRATELEMGIRPVIVDAAVRNDDTLLIYGSGFNQYSKVYLSGKAEETMYVWPELILVKEISGKKLEKLEIGDISVWQTGKDKVPLGEAEMKADRIKEGRWTEKIREPETIPIMEGDGEQGVLNSAKQ